MERTDGLFLYCIGTAVSPPETPSSVQEYTTYISSSLRKSDADNNNHLVKGLLEDMGLKGRGWIVTMDFIEVRHFDTAGNVRDRSTCLVK